MVWAQNLNALERVFTLQKMLQNYQFSATWISFLKLNLLKFEDEIHLENVLLISKHINNLLPPVFDKWFTFCSNIHNYETVLVNFSNHLPKQIPMRKLQLQ